jgi:hypothetical protein
MKWLGVFKFPCQSPPLKLSSGSRPPCPTPPKSTQNNCKNPPPFPKHPGEAVFFMKKNTPTKPVPAHSSTSAITSTEVMKAGGFRWIDLRSFR